MKSFLICLMDQKSNLVVLVPRDKLTTQGLYPSSLELYDQFDLTDCHYAVERWDESWSYCPICMARYEADGFIIHLGRQLQ